jgi:hypothetical protein
MSLIANIATDAGEGGPDAPLPRPIGGRPVPNFIEKNIDRGSRHFSPNMPPIIANFAGLGFGFSGFSAAGTPPDTNGDVGPNHYVHIVNSSFVVLDKNDGHAILAPTRINVPFAGFTGAGGACATTNQGDPLVRYDAHADRWIISQLTPAGTFGSGPHYECVAVSRTGDPGSMSSQWYQYAFGPYTVQGGGNALNDYPKTGVWPDGYYTTYNMFAAPTNGFRGAKFTVWERAAMVAGFPAREIDFQTFSDPHGQDGYGGALPNDWDGRLFPPANAPGLIVSDDNTPVGAHGMGPVLQVWKIHADWINPEQSTITDIPQNCPSAVLTGPCPILVNVNDFKLPCNNFETTGACVPQLGTTNKLDTLGDRLMYRLPYRNFGDRESILVPRSVDPGTNAPVALRWYELQNPTGRTFADGQQMVQQGTYAPNDGKYRWMMSMAQDHVANMAVGLSESSTSTYPEIWIAGRKFDDPPSTLPQDEVQMFQGTSFAADAIRWGDYSMMSVDPTDDCTFYYTQEYMAAPQTLDRNYNTRVGSFKFDSCQANEDNFQFEMPARVNVGTPMTFNITKRHSDGTIDDQYNGTADLRSTDPRVSLQPSATFVSGRADNVSATFQTTGFRQVIATDHSTATIQGWGNLIVDSGPPATLAVLSRFPAHLRSGSSGSVTFVAHDALGNIVSGYTGTANVMYSDPNASGPATLTFVNGVGALPNVTMITMGEQSITVTDPAQPELTVTATTAVDPYKYFFSNVPAMPIAGQSFSFHLQARDGMNRPSAAYTNRQVRMSASSDPRATFPSTVTFTDGDADVSPVTLFLAGGRTIMATDTLNAASSSNTNAQSDIGQPLVSPSVQPAATSTFTVRVSPTVDFPTASLNGASVTATCASLDAYGNITSSNVTVHFTSDDANAELPGDATLVNGQRNGLVFTFHSDGTRHVTITQVDDPSIHGTTAGTYVHPDHYTFDAISGQACASTMVHAAARFANGNLDTTYDHLDATPSSSDTTATFNPATVTFTGGQATYAVTFRHSGNQTVTLKDRILTSLSATSSPTNITAATTSSLTFNGLPSNAQTGTSVPFSLTAKDGCGNAATDATVSFTTGDPQASLPSNTSFAGTNGTVSNLAVTFNTAGSYTITATKVGGGASATSSAITVTAPSTQQPPQAQTASSGCTAAAGSTAPFALMGVLLVGWQLAQGGRSRRRRTKMGC